MSESGLAGKSSGGAVGPLNKQDNRPSDLSSRTTRQMDRACPGVPDGTVADNMKTARSRHQEPQLL